MPRIPRFDAADTWHHVMNRGIARRTLFENELDIRTFLSRVALRVRAGQIELHAFAILTTHYHLLVRSPAGELSAAMCEIHREYSRWFNRTRRRDGPLFRGRFVSKHVDSLEYRDEVVRYIDHNPVAAGLVAHPSLYPHGSARWYALPEGPIWLAREWIEETVCRRARKRAYDPADYSPVFGQPLGPEQARLLERRLYARRSVKDPLADLIGAAQGEVLEWMRSKAELADGMPLGSPVCEPGTVQSVVRRFREQAGEWPVQTGRKSSDGWALLGAGLLRELAGLGWQEIADHLGLSRNGAWQLAQRHRRMLATDDEYARRSAAVAHAALRDSHGLSVADPNR